MRYALRNKKKIKESLGVNVLKNIIASLDAEFSSTKEFEMLGDEKYKMIAVNDLNRTCGIIIFYVIEARYDVLKLAFKEFVS
jgi:hypothetical protein